MHACPLCGLPASYIQTHGLTISTCSNCCQSSVLERGVIIRIDKDKLLGQAYIQRDLLMIALTMQALYKNWEQIVIVPMPEG